MKKTGGRAKLKANILPDEVQQTEAPEAIADNLETVRLSFGSNRGKPIVSYDPDVAPRRFAIADDETANDEPVLELETNQEIKSIKNTGNTVLTTIGLGAATGWIAFSLLFADSHMMTVVTEYAQAAMPGAFLFFGIFALHLITRQEKRREESWRKALSDVFDIEESKLHERAKEAKGLARHLSDVQLQMRGVNTQMWVLQKNIGDINALKSDLEYLGQEISTFSTVSRRTIMDWEAQLLQTGQQLEHIERTTQRLSHDSLESSSFLADRLEEVGEQLVSLNDLQQDASDGTRRFEGVVKQARDDMKEMIAESKAQSEAATIAQNEFRSSLKAHVSDLSKELEALGNMARVFDGVRADMGQAAQVLSRGVRESLMDVKLLLGDWKETKTQLEGVLATATSRMHSEFDTQLSSAKTFLSEWDYMINSRLGLLIEAQTQIQTTLDEVPLSLQTAAKAVVREAPELLDKMGSFRHVAASMQQSLQEAHTTAEKLANVAPDLSQFKNEVGKLAEQAMQARVDIERGLANTAPHMTRMDDVVMRAQKFFDEVQGKAIQHVGKLSAMEDVLKRLQAPMAVNGVMEQLQPLITTIDKLNERCDELEKRAAQTRNEFESLDLKPLMKKMVLDIEAVFDQSIDVLSAIKPSDAALRQRDDLPALTIRLRQVLEGVRPVVLAASLRNKQELREAARSFTARFGTICEEARASSPQGEWVATALASSELGKIYRLLQKALDS